jgi:hypothetical protein
MLAMGGSSGSRDLVRQLMSSPGEISGWRYRLRWPRRKGRTVSRATGHAGFALASQPLRGRRTLKPEVSDKAPPAPTGDAIHASRRD